MENYWAELPKIRATMTGGEGTQVGGGELSPRICKCQDLGHKDLSSSHGVLMMRKKNNKQWLKEVERLGLQDLFGE